MIYQTAVALALVGAASASVYTADVKIQKTLWENFKRDHNKNYENDAEDAKRFGIFLENLKIVDERNMQERKNGGSARHGVTKFSDLAQNEFARGYLNAKGKTKSTTGIVENNIPPFKAGASSSKDWTGIYTTPVKNQGYCGGCWAFSATEQIETDIWIATGTEQILSPEQIIQCDKTSQGCNGGWTEHAYDYVKNAGGIETEAAYPYTSYAGSTGSCHSNSANYVVKLNSYSTIAGSSTSDTESQMTTYVLNSGPLSVCLDASTWNSYTGGVMSAASCGTDVDHCVQAVGVNTDPTSGYWKVRNQWGTSWGEQGFIRLQYGANACDITNDPTHTAVQMK